MPFEFHKMHGAGNDFVLIDQRSETFDARRETARALADRHRGVGFDQLAVIAPGGAAELPEARRVRWSLDVDPQEMY